MKHVSRLGIVRASLFAGAASLPMLMMASGARAQEVPAPVQQPVRPTDAPAQPAAEGPAAEASPPIADVPEAAASTVTAQDDVSAAATTSDVVVTGSRIVRDGSQAPTPVTVTTAQQLIDSKPLVSEALNDLPSVQVGSQRTGGAGSSGQGFATVSLRNLGTGRTLVLLDGRRVVPSSSSGAVDTSLIPNNLLSRVEVVTGGASAAYGADAVAGVVNYIVDTRFTGLKATVEAGLSQRGDVPEYQGSISFGASFADGRGHLLLGAEAYKSNGIRQLDRPFFLDGSQNLLPNPCVASAPATANCPSVGGPAFLRATNVRLVAGNPGGLIISGPLRGITFEDGGTTRPFVYGSYVGSRFQLGGEGDASPGGDGGPRTTAVGWLERANSYARVGFEATDKLEVFAENLLGWSNNENVAGWPYALGAVAFRVQRDNAFLPQSIRDRMVALNLSNISVAKQLTQWPSYTTVTKSLTWRAMGGATYKFADNWRAEAYFVHGQNRRNLTLPGMFDQIAAYNAADSVVVPATNTPAGLVAGTIVCRSTLSNPRDGCVPLNIFGPNSASAEAIRVTSALRYPSNVTRYTQDVVSASISGDLFQLPAGALSIAAGAERRWEKLTFTSDAYSQVRNPVTGSFGGYRTGNALPFAGDLNVTEYFAEAVLPVFKDAPLAHLLELNVAGRITDYSTSGVVKTWKAGVLYNPIADLRFRLTRSRDIRAPTLENLFSKGAAGTASLNDRFRGVDTAGVRTITEGNPDLRPEIANTLVYGLVYQPAWFPGFTVSVDRYDIKIKDAIASIANQTIIDQCFRNQTSNVCGFIVRDANGVLTAINNRPFNFAFANTDGLDLEMSLRKPTPDWVPALGGGDFSLRVLATRVFHNNTQTPGEAINENAGEVTSPKWQALAQLTVSKNGWRGFLQANFRDKYVIDNAYVLGVDIDDNTVESVTYFDARLSKDFKLGGGNVTWSFSINNLFDRQPPALTVGSFGSRDYDVVGRYFRSSLSFKF